MSAHSSWRDANFDRNPGANVNKSDDQLDLLADHLSDADTAWSIGSFGAIAEFMRDADEDVILESVRGAIAAVLSEAGSALGGVRLAGGLGRVCHTLGDYAESHREAALALEVARASTEGGRLRTHEELGFYGLVARAVDPPMLDALAERALEPLLRSDARGGGQYVRTLAMFLRSDRRLKPAAAALHVHVNTLRYRLARIEHLLGVDLEDVDARFQLEFAMKLLEARGRIATDHAGVADRRPPAATHRWTAP